MNYKYYQILETNQFYTIGRNGSVNSIINRINDHYSSKELLGFNNSALVYVKHFNPPNQFGFKFDGLVSIYDLKFT